LKDLLKILAISICILLTACGKSGLVEAPTESPIETPVETSAPKITEAPTETPTQTQKEVQKPISSAAETPKPKDFPIETEKPDNGLYCTISITCTTALDKLTPEKKEVIPADGKILTKQKVEFHEGETAFNVLLRETKKNKIHMEFTKTPIYKSSYIEGIGNLYELDCGELSGWMYKVNGAFPSYSSSNYYLKSGDEVEWIYSCDLGKDVGNMSGKFQVEE